MATGICLLLLVLTVNAQEPRLAEKASTAGAVPNSLDPNVVGSTLGGDYHNGYFDFEIRHIPGWTTMSRGMLTVNEAVGRDALGVKAGRNRSRNRVFGMHDGGGQQRDPGDFSGSCWRRDGLGKSEISPDSNDDLAVT
jgi:hypothetical protein